MKPPIYYALGKNSCGALRDASSFGSALENEISKIRSRSRLVEDTPDGLERWQTPLGEFWNPKGNAIFLALAEQSRRNYGEGPYRVKPGNIVLDCGANIGDFVREALSAGAKQVVAIEPVPRNVACLQRTFSKEIAAGKVQVVPKGVWNEAGRMRMALHSNTLVDTLIDVENARAERYLDVPLTTIDAVVGELGLERVDFIKMDIEGAETNALKGARHTIAEFKPQMAIATEHSPQEYEEVLKAVRDTGAAYESDCGSCLLRSGELYPETILLTPQ